MSSRLLPKDSNDSSPPGTLLLRQGQVIAVQLSSMPDRDCNSDQAEMSCC